MDIGFFDPLLSSPNKEGTKNFSWYLASLLCFLFFSHGFSEPIPEAIDRQNPSHLFHEGRIEAAARVAFEAFLRDPKDWKSLKILGWVALMKNQLEDASRFLQKGLALNPEDTEMKRLLAICYYREGKLEQSADLLTEIREGWTANLLTQLEPKAFDVLEPQTSIKLDESYPFVGIPVKICRKKVSFFLDTRSSFTALDRALYEKIKDIRLLDTIALQFWFNFAGKWSIRARTGIIQSLQIGDMKIERIPILLARWKGTYLFPQHVPQIVHGVIGTDMMRQFNVTIDYPKKELFLQKREASFSERSFLGIKDGSTVTKLPFYLTPGGQILIQGKINDQEGIFFMVDSLDVGRAFTFSEWMLEKFHLPRYGGG
ncbi:tetratricopeptide repeat protein [Methylacidiphilum kamchatkense]|uniref:Aspartyl protease n=1 Tax=Methylacidiphilum kamchatkense Kam1 TaxID=1202785 RepID=A0A516TN46_9BACT|nr:tetratricopeptide repeat protein [Methylacidiphilum kamchatkense]QDQ42666.1 aspartyl protease [Methylacidiphilum kamchatkense Kam1]